MSKKRKLHYKDTDFLRFIAVIPIFLYCSFFLLNPETDSFLADATVIFDALKKNSLDFFFFLSAFLIGAHALREYKYNNKFHLRHFYIRRMLRIFPVLMPSLLFGFLIHPWIIHVLKLTEITIPKMTSHFLMFPRDYGFFSREQYIYFAAFWIIISFLLHYLFIGFILKFFKDYIRIIAFALIAIGLASRAYHLLNESIYEFNVLSFGIPIGAGLLLAMIMRNSPRISDTVKSLTKRNHALAYFLGGCTVVAGYFFTSTTFLSLLVPLITCSFFAYVVLEQTYSKVSLVKFRRFRFFSKLGRLSLGLVTYQSIILVITLISMESLELNTSAPVFKVLFVLISLTLTYLVANFSFRFIEKAADVVKHEFKKS